MPGILHKAKQCAAEHNGENNDGIQPILHEAARSPREHQDQHERTAELAEQHAQPGQLTLLAQHITSVPLQAGADCPDTSPCADASSSANSCVGVRLQYAGPRIA